MHYTGSPADLLHPPPYAIQERRGSHKRRPCPICSFSSQQTAERRRPPLFPVMPYLIHKSRPHHIRTCRCPQRAHLGCLASCEKKEIDCEVCGYVYRPRMRLFFSRLISFTTHVLSLGSMVGLVFGLAQLGSALDKLGLGSEAGTKLDGDETWQDHELQQIMEWLQLVHYATGAAGEALLGLVYVVGVCGVIGVDRTVYMLDDIIHVNLQPLLRSSMPDYMRKSLMALCLTLLGLTLGTYLLFYSWIWACLLHHVSARILNVTPSSKA